MTVIEVWLKQFAVTFNKIYYFIGFSREVSIGPERIVPSWVGAENSKKIESINSMLNNLKVFLVMSWKST